MTLPPQGELPDPDALLSEPGPALIEEARHWVTPIGVLGAGGKMGLHVAGMARRALDAAGRGDDRVVAVSRFETLHSCEEFQSRGIGVIRADLLDEMALQALPGLGTVIFLAGIKFGSANHPEDLRRFNEEMPARVAHRFSQSRIVALSTGCVYPFVHPTTGGSREEDPPAPSGDYAVSCRGRELAFAEKSLRHGTQVVLIRLNYSVEFRYGVLVDIAQKVLRGEPVDVTTGYVNVIWQRDAVEYILRSVGMASAPAAVLNIAGCPVVSVRLLAQKFGELFSQVPDFTGREEPTAWLNDASLSHRTYGPPATSLDEMIELVGNWLLSGGETLGKPTKFEVRDGKF